MKKKNSNINKIKELCTQLSNRDVQLKVNEKALWIIVEKLSKTEDLINHALSNKEEFCKNSLCTTLLEISESIRDAKNVLNSSGCKRIS
jgi:hypothetical protein